MSGLSVLLAVGVTTGGARLIAGRTTLALEQPTTACPVSESCDAPGGPYGASGSGHALGETPAPGDPSGDPNQNDPDQYGQDEPGPKDTAKKDTAKTDTAQDPQATPVSTAASGGPDRDQASARTRTPSTAAPRASSQESPRVDDAPAAVTDVDGGVADTVPGDEPVPDGGDLGGKPGADGTGSALHGDAAVGVRFTVTGRHESGYTARLVVRNEGPALPAWTIRLSVGGLVTAVDGADWTQRGDALTLSSRTALDEGGALTLTISADGASAAPGGCVLFEGRCEVTGPGRSGRHG
ncbi:hypothetical protein [Microbispora sp. H11081]|uniref:hypothetical protein n=1 Tax=Microbispora sp. H11081 TaxID=2729107 RepID=UPI00147660E2|nr:hypothetical protein [Microbispora sp. H11081]